MRWFSFLFCINFESSQLHWLKLINSSDFISKGAHVLSAKKRRERENYPLPGILHRSRRDVCHLKIQCTLISWSLMFVDFIQIDHNIAVRARTSAKISIGTNMNKISFQFNSYCFSLYEKIHKQIFYNHLHHTT